MKIEGCDITVSVFDDLMAHLRSQEPWKREALCLEHPEIDFLAKHGGHAGLAKAVCAGCPVRVDCLDYALTNGEKFGVWGGTTERDRRRARALRRQEPLVPDQRGMEPEPDGDAITVVGIETGRRPANTGSAVTASHDGELADAQAGDAQQRFQWQATA